MNGVVQVFAKYVTFINLKQYVKVRIQNAECVVSNGKETCFCLTNYVGSMYLQLA